MSLHTIELWFLWFILYSIIGWMYESTLCSVAQKKIINRGFLNGPYCPIYGSGAILVIAVLGRIQNPILLFFLGAILCCTLEYLTSYGMEKLFHARWWDYSRRRFNINGRVCLIGAIVFGAFSAILIKLLHPWMTSLTDRLTETVLHVLSGILLAGFLADCIITIRGFAGFHQKIEEISLFLEQQMQQQKLQAVEKLYGSEVYKGMQEMLGLVKGKLNAQQRRMIAAFPTLRLKRPEQNEILGRIRAILRKYKAE